MTEKETDRDDKKTERVLFLWDRLSRGGSVSRQEMVETFGVNLRTASRYLAEIRKYLAEREEQDHVHRELYYDRARKVYRIRELEEEMIRPSELYAIGKSFLPAGPFIKRNWNPCSAASCSQQYWAPTKRSGALYTRRTLRLPGPGP